MMGHLGLTPQSINKFGTYNVRAKEDAEVDSVAYYSLDGTRVTAPGELPRAMHFPLSL